ncbi:hypothetical protein GCM10023189_54840 [Nibrella saemangeumensis]|uniref:HTH araC/xylS-type domain-containing protein n=1 Tax=Nibrella saemangeumensis TaxID=1084526 RepID=A0ABP8NL22_9BACT
MYTNGELCFVSDAINLSFGPVVYLYLRQALTKQLSFRAGLHLLPPVLFMVVYWYLMATEWQPFDYRKYIGQPFHRTVLGVIALSFTFYAYRYNWLLTKFQQGQPAYRREVLSWLYIFLAFFLLKALVAYLVFARQWLPVAYKPNSIQVLEIIFVLIDAIIILTSGVLVLRQNDILNLEKVELFIQTIMPGRKKTTVVTEPMTHIAALQRLMTEKKLFTQPDLNEKVLASTLDIPSYQLSILLNEHIGKSFSEFINEYRIEEAKRQLLDPRTAANTMFAIAVDCGYNSESVFYTNFKKYTGTTPKKFQASQLQQSANPE